MTLLEQPLDAPPDGAGAAAGAGASPAAVAAGGAHAEGAKGAPGARAGAPAPAWPGWGPALAAALAAAAPAALVGGLFEGWAATAVAALAAAGGAALAGTAARSSRTVLWQLLAVPVVAVAAAASALPGAHGALGRLGPLIAEAVGLGRTQPSPLPFDPGWRPILVVGFGAIGLAAGWVAAGAGRARLALALPLPAGALAAVALPPAAEARAAGLAGLSLFAAFAVLHATDPGRISAAGPARGALRAVATAALVGLGVAGLARVEALFPSPRLDAEPSPRHPVAAVAPEDDRVLFEVAGPLDGPWQLGALEVYDDGAWLLRPADPDALVALATRPDPAGAGTVAVTITVGDLGAHGALPVPAELAALDAPPGVQARLDPRSGAVVLRGPVAAGTSYVAHARPPGGYPLGAQRPDVHGEDDPALSAPALPARLAALLPGLPGDPWQRFLALRAQLAEAFVAAGGGGPVPISAERVGDLLGGAEGSPYERAAAEALLARWSGVPARVGFGYAGGEVEGGRRVIRPRHGAYWVEVRLVGRGWVPLLPDAARAAPPPPGAEQLARAGVAASEEVPVDLIVPIRRTNPVLAYQRARGVLVALLIPAALATAGWLAWPMAARAARRRRRRTWAEAGGPRARVAVAYAEWRDLAIDVGVGGRSSSPLRFCEFVAPDPAHEQLAWLVTRALYGDLSEALTDDDARTAEELAASLRRRLASAQPVERRVGARLSRASLLTPFSAELPGAPRLGSQRRRAPAWGAAQAQPAGATP